MKTSNMRIKTIKEAILMINMACLIIGATQTEATQADEDVIWKELQELKQHYARLDEENVKFKQEISTLKQALKGKKLLKMEGEELVSFTAYNGQSDWPMISNGVNIPFPNVINNNGGYYDTSTSTFTCPVRGLYYFSTSIMSYYTSLDFHISVAGEVVATSRAYTDYDWGSVSASATVFCDANNAVSVVSMVDGRLYGEQYSSFTGYLISVISDPPDEGAELVSFTAENSLLDYPTVSIGTNLAFPNIVNNDGNYYDPQTSTFRCPKKGLYYFSTTIMSYYTTLDFYLSMDGENLATSRAHTGYDWGSSTISVTVFCNEDQLVSVVSLVDGQMYGQKFCSFTGFLVAIAPY